MKIIKSTLFLTLLLILSVAGSAMAQDWTPKPALLAKLTPAQSLREFKMRLPHGLKLDKEEMTKADITQHLYFWHLPKRTSLLGGLAVTVTSAPDGQTPEGALSDWITMVTSHNITDLTQSDVQSGMIGDVPFARCYYKGPEVKTGKITHGFVYFGINDGHLYIIEADDYEPGYAKSLPLAEAAALTFVPNDFQDAHVSGPSLVVAWANSNGCHAGSPVRACCSDCLGTGRDCLEPLEARAKTGYLRSGILLANVDAGPSDARISRLARLACI